MPMQPKPIAETSRAPSLRCFTYVPDSSALPQSYAHRLPFFPACDRSARGGLDGLRGAVRGDRLSVRLGTWGWRPVRERCNLRADHDGLAQPAGVGELLDDELGGVGARDLRHAAQFGVLAGAVAAAARAVGQLGRADDGPIEAAAADEVVGDRFVRVDVPQREAKEDLRRQRRFVERLPAAERG